MQTKQRESNALLFDKLKTQEFQKASKNCNKRVFWQNTNKFWQRGGVWKMKE